MVAQGLPDFQPVQSNVAFSERRGVTRGFHAEPWDKLVTVATGRVLGAWVDLRAGDGFGRVFSLEIDPSVAVFIPRGVANAYQVLEDATSYVYLVNDHWRPDIDYVAVALDDPDVAVDWPVLLGSAEISEKDLRNPRLAEVEPFPEPRALILGADGQVGRALQTAFPDAHPVGRAELDLTDSDQVRAWPWHSYDVVLNAAAFTGVDKAESPEGRRAAWALNASAPALLAEVTREHRLTLVHFSSDYVFDGTAESYDENAPLSPLGVYGQSKAAGDLAVAGNPRHYILRSSWVVGDGPNFVRTMLRLREGRGLSLRRRRPARSAHLRRRDGPSGAPPDLRSCAFRHLQLHGRRPGGRLGRHRRGGLHGCGTPDGCRSPGVFRGVRCREVPRP